MSQPLPFLFHMTVINLIFHRWNFVFWWSILMFKNRLFHFNTKFQLGVSNIVMILIQTCFASYVEKCVLCLCSKLCYVIFTCFFFTSYKQKQLLRHIWGMKACVFLNVISMIWSPYNRSLFTSPHSINMMYARKKKKTFWGPPLSLPSSLKLSLMRPCWGLLQLIGSQDIISKREIGSYNYIEKGILELPGISARWNNTAPPFPSPPSSRLTCLCACFLWRMHLRCLCCTGWWSLCGGNKSASCHLLPPMSDLQGCAPLGSFLFSFFARLTHQRRMATQDEHPAVGSWWKHLKCAT